MRGIKFRMTSRDNILRFKNMNNNITVRFNGGLGNQMFQWAFARAIENHTGIKTFMDMTFFKKNYSRPYELDIFNAPIKKAQGFCTNLKLELIWKLRKKLKGKKFLGTYIYEEPHFEFDANVFNVMPNTYIHGYIIGFFQSEKYFKTIENDIREDFKFKPEPDEINRAHINKINSTNSISLHIRRGDYVQKKKYQNVYATCSLDYYKRGVENIFKNTNEPPTLFIFSDDKDWVKENLKLPFETVFVDNNSGEKSYEDMRLMSLCKHNIIANSSFSWWGAWLNNNKEKIVIAPQKWFNDEKIIQTDVIPESWIRLEN